MHKVRTEPMLQKNKNKGAYMQPLRMQTTQIRTLCDQKLQACFMATKFLNTNLSQEDEIQVVSTARTNPSCTSETYEIYSTVQRAGEPAIKADGSISAQGAHIVRESLLWSQITGMEVQQLR